MPNLNAHVIRFGIRNNTAGCRNARITAGCPSKFNIASEFILRMNVP